VIYTQRSLSFVIISLQLSPAVLPEEAPLKQKSVSSSFSEFISMAQTTKLFVSLFTTCTVVLGKLLYTMWLSKEKSNISSHPGSGAHEMIDMRTHVVDLV
jgi:hypothetical protein